MEGIQTINALKAVVSSLPAQTTIPSSELVMLYAADGTPIAKIARDDLVKAVASVMASNSQNTFSKLLGVQANGTPMGIGASDLASVLGVMKKKSVSINMNEVFQFQGKGIIMSVSAQDNAQNSNGIVVYSNYGTADAVLLANANAAFSGTKGNSNTLNFYTENGVCCIQNNWATTLIYYTLLQSY